MPAASATDALQIQNLSGDELSLLEHDASAATEAQTPRLSLQASSELRQKESVLGREQAHYLRQVLQMPPEELAQNLQQLQATQAQLAFERQQTQTLSEKITTLEAQWQGVSAALVLLCLFLFLWGWRQRRQRQGQAPSWRTSVLAQSTAQASDSGNAYDQVEAGAGANAEARVSEIWADSRDWLQHEEIVQAAAFSQADPHTFGHSHPHGLESTELHALSVPGQPDWMAWASDAQPQPEQPLVDYLRSLRRMLLRLIELGRLADASSLLYAHLCLVPATSPWAYMAYFALQTSNSAQQQEARQRFTEQFDRPAPMPSEYQGGGSLQQGLADYQYSLTQLAQAWPTERAVLLLENWLAPDKRRSFTLQAYDDLFVLYDVLDQLHGIAVYSTNKGISS